MFMFTLKNLARKGFIETNKPKEAMTHTITPALILPGFECFTNMHIF